jgi:hypothetical protein
MRRPWVTVAPRPHARRSKMTLTRSPCMNRMPSVLAQRLPPPPSPRQLYPTSSGRCAGNPGARGEVGARRFRTDSRPVP